MCWAAPTACRFSTNWSRTSYQRMKVSGRRTTAWRGGRSRAADGAGQPGAGTRSVGRAAQFGSAFRFRFGFDRLDLAALDMRGLDAHGHICMRGIGRAALRRRMQRTRLDHGAGHQHLGSALMTEIAIGKAHAGDRSAEAALVLLVEIEAGLERNALDRRADRLAADLQRIARQTHVTNWAGAVELHRACRTHVIEYPACATGAIETGKGKHLAGYKPAGLIGTHLDGQSGNDHRTGRNGPQHETRKHAVTPTDSSAGNRLMSLYPLLTIPTV